MLLIVLGILDLLSALSLILLAIGIPIKFLIIAAAVYLAAKGLIFFKDLASIFDIISAIALTLSFLFVLPNILLVILAIVLVQKAFFSFFS